jgi:16S rRNA (cytidine1402-2'-O)-methyltransferase
VPIGNLRDASPRLLEVLEAVDVVACEDTRTTGRLLDLLGVSSRPRLLAHHDHNEVASAAGIIALLLDGADVALVSDAGTPAVSDPGSQLVRAAHEAAIPIVAIAGPSAVAAAVSVSGARGIGHRFVGFLPRGEADLAGLVDRHAGDVVVALESPHRLVATLERIATVQPDRVVTVCRELTKLHEQVLRAPASDIVELLDPAVRGEVVVVLDALEAVEVDVDVRGAVELALEIADAGVRLKDATRIAGRFVGVPARELYDAANRVRDGASSTDV